MRKSIYSPVSRQLAAFLKRLREAADLTVTDVGAALGTSHTYVVDYEAGQRRLDLAQLQRVAGALGTTLVTIVDELDATPAPAEPSDVAGEPQEFVPVSAQGSEPAAAALEAQRRRWASLLRAVRERQRLPNGTKLTQIEVARRLGATQSFVSKYERGERRIDLPELGQLAAALGTTPRALAAEFEATPGQHGDAEHTVETGEPNPEGRPRSEDQ